MSEVDENDPFKGLVTSQSMEAHRENKNYDGHFSHRDGDSDGVELTEPGPARPDDDKQ